MFNTYMHISENERYECFKNKFWMTLMVIIFVPLIFSVILTTCVFIIITLYEFQINLINILIDTIIGLIKNSILNIMELIMPYKDEQCMCSDITKN